MNLNPSQMVDAFLKEGLCVEKIASGDSMSPAIPSDSIVRIEPVLPHQIKRGDIVLFKGRDGHKKIHRIARLFLRDGQRCIQTWGDNCQFPDSYVFVNCITGRVTAVKTDSGWRKIASGPRMFFQLFFFKYGMYYMKKLPGKIGIGINQKVLVRLIYSALKIQRFLYNGLTRLKEFISGLSFSLLSPEGLFYLTTMVYNAKKGNENKGLFEWESEWFENDLPDPPARLLVGGAGAGREVKVLIKKGYYIVAFDPAARYVEKAKQENTEKNCLAYLTGSYEDLLNEHSGNSTMNQAVHTYGPYDAVILGWGSFTHISETHMRVALLQKLKQLCPQGPVLISFWMRENSEATGRKKAFKLGYRIGHHFNKRGEKMTDLPSEGDDITLHAGYGHFFSMPEIKQLVEASHYHFVENPKVSYLKHFPHITIRPSTDQ